ncbi:hypothetical protein M406DRAFT_270950 [Cryphonectria parasitica EP155]|uniref:FYVE-type domain-containing protein n=1 Tax=Cryphonectria parasitica (strain ATCC 38755 / EP155) TaxID=660469 RepID=A0A9P4YAB9_CRYP1|nr:uncharacterized protein M406DRAFT_270950 [Cryphonectria parasitica EP155]KAF3769944.1 hypothetical protein M406DRAFT_270950 [Cryphonectria parasitica EP155]
MAMADLVMPRLPDQQSSWFHHPHQHQPTGHQRSFSYHMPQHNSSDISPLSTSGSNTSPVSPKNYHGRQVRPLYVPAVLRPNEYPSSATPAKTSPGLDEADDDDRVVRSSGSFTSLSGILSLSRLSRRDSAKVVEWDWDLSNYPKVNGQPTRRHWKADQECDVCDDPTCKKYFNYFVRRHHCRRCGNIFCDVHSSREVPLDESANYNPRGQMSRCCQHCYGDFKVWRSRNGSLSLGASQALHQPHPHQPLAGSRTVPASPTPASPIAGASPTTPGKTQPEVALSVPSDWNWSTF